ncbi:hypothetical protein SAMN05216184_11332 [Georgenia satyanarayanai]|uniref:DUF5926 domain-containing protein n=1 Tax=Georgenia satyanarayanai TaxID=860221 RepID=A0A2Y9ALU7_9MICO|nr:DUF5926 family protein [Georgenia satyanarayanai]PYF97857.1 hypothetical protein A8987_11332 [Georgenia satyanarayanai]SSA45431.1 hypothetical protein SAMN05216184_11332 [Georgenia satyanarayanai]
MGKKSRKRQSESPRPKRVEVPFVERPFEGLPGETDWVAMREVVPSATATVRTTAEYGSREVVVATMLPELWPALHREDGTVLVGLQTAAKSGDASRDVAAALLLALDAEPGEPVLNLGILEPGPRLQDVLDLTVPFEPVVHDDFAFWLAEDQERDADVTAAIEQSSEGIVPTVKVAGVESAYWCRMGREFLRWARPEPQEDVLDAFARLHARRESELEEGARFVGAFRTSGILVPVWELVPGTEADELAAPCAAFEKRLEAALAEEGPLDADARRARAGIVSRQVTLR